ncbi:glycosyltransferase [Beijerinckia mobilis]|uniref:glycosyltransferase n=1 Tax=Beijerinckia mobilis TaxID=231434 RepID=UPI0005571379|nr:glycosyltransferase [Beijerinckia mobilis]
MASLSVIIPVYNGAETVPLLLDALKKQTGDIEEVEYIIVNNMSTDNTKEVVLKSAERLDLGIIYIEENQIQSAYAARNKGIRVSTGEIILFTDADCVPHPCWIVNLVAAFTDGKVGAVAGRIDAYPGETLLELFATRAEILSQSAALNHPFLPFSQTANAGFRREVFSLTGLFRDHLEAGGDIDMSWRMQRMTKFDLLYTDDAIVYHRHRKNISALYEQFRRYGRSSVYIEKLYSLSVKRKSYAPFLTRLFLWICLYPFLKIKHLFGRISKAELYHEPLAIFINIAMIIGQRQALEVDLAEKWKFDFLHPLLVER